MLPRQDRARGQETLFGTLKPMILRQEILAGLRNLPEWPDAESSPMKRSCSVSRRGGHPLEPFLGLVDSYRTHQVGEPGELPGRTIVRGWSGQRSAPGHSRKTDKPYCIATSKIWKRNLEVA